MTVTIDQIKELRESTGVSMMVCKKALEETAGDIDKAVDFLRKKGIRIYTNRGFNFNLKRKK